MYALSDALETQVVESVLQELTHPEYLFEQPELFTRELFAAYRSQGALIHLLFSGSRSGNLVAKIERAVKELAFARYPACREDPVVNIALSYAIYGGYYAYEENLRYGGEQVAEVAYMEPLKPSLYSRGSRPEWSMWAWVSSTKSSSPAAAGMGSFSKRSLPCSMPQSTRPFLSPTSI